jgi:GH18 family chitinase
MFKINLIFKFKGAFSKMANDDVMRKNFVENSVSFLQKHGFDGLELGFKTKI